MQDNQKITALDVVNELKAMLNRNQPLEFFIKDLNELVEDYDKTVEESAIELKNLTQEQADDKVLNEVAVQYGMTLNQVVGYLDICDTLNNDSGLKDSGVVAVPFWFHAQYNEQKALNEKLVEETDSLMTTMANIKNHVPESQLESLGIELPERKSIITGVTQPYIPGITGARIGDEHLDPENVYLGDVRNK